MSEEQNEPEPIKLSLETEPISESNSEDCLPCQALDRLCSILPEEDGRKACEEIKAGLENDTMTADEAREYLASRVGRHVLATKLSEVSEWIAEQEIKRQEVTASIAESIPLQEETEVVIPKIETELPPLPEEMTKSMDEIAPLIGEPSSADGFNPDGSEMYLDEPETWPKNKEKETKEKSFYDPDDEIIYKDLFDTDMEDDPTYMYDDTDVWIKDGLIDDDE